MTQRAEAGCREKGGACRQTQGLALTFAPLSRETVAQAAALLAHAPDRWSAASVAEELDSPASVDLLAFSQGQAVGFCACTLAADEASVNNIVTAPGLRRRGVGTALLKEALDGLYAAGARQVFLEVRRDDPAPRALYAKLGFTAVGSRKNFYGPGADALIMKKEREANL